MSDYRDSKPIVILPPVKELKGDGKPMYPDRYPELVDTFNVEREGNDNEE